MNAYVFQGAAAGLSRGLKDVENRHRQDTQDQRVANQDVRSQESHDLAMKTGKNTLDEQAIKLAHDQFGAALDPALGAFIMSDGANTQPLVDVARKHVPGAENFGIARGDDGSFTVDDGRGNKSPPMDFEHVVGMAVNLRDPANFAKVYQDRMAKNLDRTQKNADEIAKEERAGQRDLVKGDRQHSYRMSEKGVASPKIEIGDDGKPYSLSSTGVQAIPGAASGLTFRGADKGRRDAMTNQIDAFAEHLPKVAGEDQDAHWMRAAYERAKLIGKTNPEQAVAEYEKSLTAKLISPDMITNMPPGTDEKTGKPRPTRLDQARETIRSMVGDFAKQYSPRRPGMAAPGNAPGIAPPAGSAPPPGNTPQASNAPRVYHHQDLGQFTDVDLERTAKESGMTVDQVKQQLGIQ